MLVFAIILTYVWASIPWGIVVAKIMGQADPRTVGSGNIGATNIYRSGGWRLALVVALLDVGKGVIPVFLAVDHRWALIFGVVAMLGHIFSCFLVFKGGKGVATAFGALLGLYPLQSLVLLALWAGIVALTKYVSLASLVTLLAHGILTLFYHPKDLWFSGCLIALVFYAHRANIKRLWNGSEKAIC